MIATGGFFINKSRSNKSKLDTLNKEQESLYIETETNISNKESIQQTKPLFSYSNISGDIKNKMLGLSMPESEPLSFDSLSYLTLSYYGFDRSTHVGNMVVDKRVASEVVDIFKEVYEKKYPIDKIRLIDEYNAVDNLSMVDNNSSSFCYRTIANTSVISNHGKGLAIDINPLQNPHVVGTSVNPEEGYVFADRSNIQMGMIVEGDDLYNAFIKRGWSWGGHWKNADYQHFEKKID